MPRADGDRLCADRDRPGEADQKRGAAIDTGQLGAEAVRAVGPVWARSEGVWPLEQPLFAALGAL
jgi:hypothetical protein